MEQTSRNEGAPSERGRETEAARALVWPRLASNSLAEDSLGNPDLLFSLLPKC